MNFSDVKIPSTEICFTEILTAKFSCDEIRITNNRSVPSDFFISEVNCTQTETVWIFGYLWCQIIFLKSQNLRQRGNTAQAVGRAMKNT